jgi:hypothetical protein
MFQKHSLDSSNDDREKYMSGGKMSATKNFKIFSRNIRLLCVPKPMSAENKSSKPAKFPINSRFILPGESLFIKSDKTHFYGHIL